MCACVCVWVCGGGGRGGRAIAAAGVLGEGKLLGRISDTLHSCEPYLGDAPDLQI